MATIDNIIKAELVRADTALQSFRDGGYNFTDAIGEIVDNSIQAGARKIKFDWKFDTIKSGKSTKVKRVVSSFAISDDGMGIAPNILPNVLTIGFSTRYNSREGMGRFGVGFKLASISQAKRLEIYTKPGYLELSQDKKSGTYIPQKGSKNTSGKIYMSYLDLDEIADGKQNNYIAKEVETFPEEYQHLMDGLSSGTLIIWRNIDRMNESRAYSESPDEKIAGLGYFLSRTYRIYIDKGLKIFLPNSSGQLFEDIPLTPYDPTFQIENPDAEALAKGESMKGELVEEGEIVIDNERVFWKVYLTPKITRLVSGGGGIKGPLGDGQFKKLQIPDNQGKISFLRQEREICYVKVPYLITPDSLDRNGHLDRHIGIEVLFPPALDEYFQVRHIKRGVEPVEKLKKELKLTLNKPIKTARKRIRDVWSESQVIQSASNPDDYSGGRDNAEETVKFSNTSMPKGRSGDYVTPDAEKQRLLEVAESLGIQTRDKQEEFAELAQQKPTVALEIEWPGKGLIDIEHLNKTILVKINKRHPFIKEVYAPIKDAIAKDAAELDPDFINHIFRKAIDGIDLLLFAYAKAESMNDDPESVYMELREDWGKFTASYLKKRDELNIL
ncbi:MULTISPECIES: ATP-binding protein [unclassified Sphingobacterium]|uniref:ATP-binding protein n=1 Tax=unclassified Sphingobacterium TaxID=2609468 RepID=UPI0025F20C45|nr:MULTISPECIES: ATP-binding protein [unclassified Sphingobacterium]